MKNCKTCDYFKPIWGQNYEPLPGYCVRYPPLPTLNSEGDEVSLWPDVYDINGCGEHKDREDDPT